MKPAAPSISDGEDEILWYAGTVQEAMQLQSVTADGLNAAEVTSRLAQYGKNEITPPPKPGFLRKLWNQVNNILIFILIAATIVSAILEEWPEVALILGVVVINVTIGLVQEGKAEKAADAIKGMLSSKATVIRNGERTVVKADEVVPGDIVFIQSGDRVPADLRMIECSNLAILEAMLTGESNPINKHTDVVEAGAALGDRKNLAFSATMVMQGQGKGIVVGTGDLTEIGKISSMVGGVDAMKTNLMVQLEIFGRWISCFVFVVGSITFVISFKDVGVGSDDIGDAFKSAVSVAVAIIPEGLPAVVTISLALAMQMLAKRNAIIRQLPAVETLGSVTVICSDKTGTLTKNEMTVQAIQTSEEQIDISGVGYAPEGEASVGGKVVTKEKLGKLLTMFEGAVLCNDSGLGQNDKGHWEPVGYPTEVALLTLGMKLGAMDWKALQQKNKRVGGVPFASEHKFMCCVHAHGSDTFLHVKGAPDRLIPKCKDQVTNNTMGSTKPINEKYWQDEAARLSAKGLRVLAVCRSTFNKSDLRSDMDADIILKAKTPFLTMIGLVAILDPPRPEAIEGVRVATRAGIVVKMITGDHPATATAIAKMLGIIPPDAEDKDVKTFTGPQLDAMSDDEMDSIVLGCNVFARASPENKISIVKSLQRMKQVCSMTGDGVNDAPALKAANIGVAMGITGTDVSKEAAKMVLADDNFATIVVAVEEGRRVWDNLVKVLMYNIPVNFAQGLSVFFSFVIKTETVPLTAIQVLYVNMVTSVTMGMMLSMEPAEGDIMARPPRRTNKRLFGKKVMWNCLFVSSFMVVAVIGVFVWSLERHPITAEEQLLLDSQRRAGASLRSPRIDAARGEAFNMLVFAEIGYAINCRYLRDSSLTSKVFTQNKWCWVAIFIAVVLQVILTYVPGVNYFFYNGPIEGMAWVRIIGFSIVIFLLVEFEKKFGSKYLMPMLRPVFEAFGKFVPQSMAYQRTETQMQATRFIATSASSAGVPHMSTAHKPPAHPHGHDHPVNKVASRAAPHLHHDLSGPKSMMQARGSMMQARGLRPVGDLVTGRDAPAHPQMPGGMPGMQPGMGMGMPGMMGQQYMMPPQMGMGGYPMMMGGSMPPMMGSPPMLMGGSPPMMGMGSPPMMPQMMAGQPTMMGPMGMSFV
eukprot:CAMPEP_0173380530 /NCGR_PEP_ID=MMETSP1356-20130122/3202_1 /TAXON_ID=77927 ORGANISM="Hemiselmis virescens, Strain PCC157" /NCGR_SAMPLE_ID=MMETSP1356 /ASSEMBLY_ACC=CAM_ASM_000847 /LENGTH=1147 /DNA_ID=CAMNT_0014334157 /DNA_START=96 /DNA_END=3539 /DNA_ORIENTATION=+